MQSILGHQRAIDVLQAALISGRMHHAWIFHGPPGVGKATTALALAKILLCHDPQTDLAGRLEACGVCKSCRIFNTEQAAHPDLHIVTKELALYADDKQTRDRKLTSIPVDIVRLHLIEPAYRSAALNHNKVFILDEAELLNDAGQNALLKCLEEPPPGTFIILVTSQEDRLLATIRSRCQRVAFAELDHQVVERWLDQQPFSQSMSPAQKSWVAKFARGSLGRAALAAEYGLDEWQQTISPMINAIAAGRGAPDMGEAMATRVEEFAKAWVKNHDNASKDAANKMAVRLMLGVVGEICRQSLHHRSAPLTDAAAHPWLVGIDLIQIAERNLNSNVSLPLLLDHLAIEWSDQCRRQPAGR